MKTSLALVAALLPVTALFAQGPLTPPTGANPAVGPENALSPGGAPQATMKTLHQVEPRIPISSLPFTISSSGSYYFTQNLHFTAPTGNAITVSTSNVTIDLMGFTLSSDTDVTGYGIALAGNVGSVVVRDGFIVGASWVYSSEISPRVYQWAAGATGGFTSGIGVEGSTAPAGCRFSDLTVSNCRGIGVVAMYGSTVERCHARDNIGGGFMLLAASASDCTAVNNMTLGGFYTPLQPGSRFTGCVAIFNAGAGFSTSMADLSRCTADRNEIGIGASGSSVSHCNSFRNMGHGIFASNGTVMHCKVTANGGDGIAADYGVVTASSAERNDGIGINAYGGSVSQCVARESAQHGIYATAGVISQCVASGNNTSATVPFTDIFPSAPNPVSRTGNFPAP